MQELTTVGSVITSPPSVNDHPANTYLYLESVAFSLLIESAIFDEKASIDTEYYESMKNEIIGWKN